MPPSETQTHVLSVPDISCDHCKTSIESAVGALVDVEQVNVDIDAKTVHVTGGDYGKVVGAIGDAGYEIA